MALSPDSSALSQTPAKTTAQSIVCGVPVDLPAGTKLYCIVTDTTGREKFAYDCRAALLRGVELKLMELQVRRPTITTHATSNTCTNTQHFSKRNNIIHD